uniref:Cytohesin 1 n=1 Tax=Paramormyrops kingsleyae TaxID=1676925 RepID=A0A3B3SSW0_9TELE
MVLKSEDGVVPDDLTPEERQELENIRRRKQELLEDIQRLKDEIAEVTSEIENLGSTEERKSMQRNKQVAVGRKKFNMDPKKGIQFLMENDLLKNTCEDIAQFLYKGEGLNKTAIGDYLGERDEFNIQVLHAFVELHEFTDLNLVQALRQFLWSFRLPGEAQKIDRMMEAFAQRYCQCNPGVFQSTDTCYVLSFAIIMLNTSLHNPNVKDKPSVERFVAMNRGINAGGDLPEDLLRNLYDSIRNEPFKIPEDDGNDLTHTFFNPDREGWLLKLAGGRVKTWKRRWFILTDNCLYYFEYTTDKEPRGIIPLENLSIREVEDSKKPVSHHLLLRFLSGSLRSPAVSWAVLLGLVTGPGYWAVLLGRVTGRVTGLCYWACYWAMLLAVLLGRFPKPSLAPSFCLKCRCLIINMIIIIIIIINHLVSPFLYSIFICFNHTVYKMLYRHLNEGH